MDQQVAVAALVQQLRGLAFIDAKRAYEGDGSESVSKKPRTELVITDAWREEHGPKFDPELAICFIRDNIYGAIFPYPNFYLNPGVHRMHKSTWVYPYMRLPDATMTEDNRLYFGMTVFKIGADLENYDTKPLHTTFFECDRQNCEVRFVAATVSYEIRDTILYVLQQVLPESVETLTFPAGSVGGTGWEMRQSDAKEPKARYGQRLDTIYSMSVMRADVGWMDPVATYDRAKDPVALPENLILMTPLVETVRKMKKHQLWWGDPFGEGRYKDGGYKHKDLYEFMELEHFASQMYALKLRARDKIPFEPHDLTWNQRHQLRGDPWVWHFHGRFADHLNKLVNEHNEPFIFVSFMAFHLEDDSTSLNMFAKLANRKWQQSWNLPNRVWLVITGNRHIWAGVMDMIGYDDFAPLYKLVILDPNGTTEENSRHGTYSTTSDIAQYTITALYNNSDLMRKLRFPRIVWEFVLFNGPQNITSRLYRDAYKMPNEGYCWLFVTSFCIMALTEPDKVKDVPDMIRNWGGILMTKAWTKKYWEEKKDEISKQNTRALEVLEKGRYMLKETPEGSICRAMVYISTFILRKTLTTSIRILNLFGRDYISEECFSDPISLVSYGNVMKFFTGCETMSIKHYELYWHLQRRTVQIIDTVSGRSACAWSGTPHSECTVFKTNAPNQHKRLYIKVVLYFDPVEKSDSDSDSDSSDSDDNAPYQRLISIKVTGNIDGLQDPFLLYDPLVCVREIMVVDESKAETEELIERVVEIPDSDDEDESDDVGDSDSESEDEDGKPEPPEPAILGMVWHPSRDLWMPNLWIFDKDKAEKFNPFTTTLSDALDSELVGRAVTAVPVAMCHMYDDYFAVALSSGTAHTIVLVLDLGKKRIVGIRDQATEAPIRTMAFVRNTNPDLYELKGQLFLYTEDKVPQSQRVIKSILYTMTVDVYTTDPDQIMYLDERLILPFNERETALAVMDQNAPLKRLYHISAHGDDVMIATPSCTYYVRLYARTADTKYTIIPSNCATCFCHAEHPGNDYWFYQFATIKPTEQSFLNMIRKKQPGSPDMLNDIASVTYYDRFKHDPDDASEEFAALPNLSGLFRAKMPRHEKWVDQLKAIKMMVVEYTDDLRTRKYDWVRANVVHRPGKPSKIRDDDKYTQWVEARLRLPPVQ